MIQKEALKILKSNSNVFLTGSAGTGKTFLLNKFIEHLKKKNIQVSVTASTGIAATHLIRKMFDIFLFYYITTIVLKKLINNERTREKRLFVRKITNMYR